MKVYTREYLFNEVEALGSSINSMSSKCPTLYKVNDKYEKMLKDEFVSLVDLQKQIKEFLKDLEFKENSYEHGIYDGAMHIYLLLCNSSEQKESSSILYTECRCGKTASNERDEVCVECGTLTKYSSPIQNTKPEMPKGMVDYILNGVQKKCTCEDNTSICFVLEKGGRVCIRCGGVL